MWKAGGYHKSSKIRHRTTGQDPCRQNRIGWRRPMSRKRKHAESTLNPAEHNKENHMVSGNSAQKKPTQNIHFGNPTRKSPPGASYIHHSVGRTGYYLISLYALALLIIPYFRGLFFDQDMIYADVILTGLSLLVLGIYWKKGTEELFQTPLPYLVFGILLVYFLSAFQGIVPALAYDEAFRWVTYFLTFLALILLLNEETKPFLFHGLLLSMLWVSLFGLFAQFGLVSFQDAILGNRISSVLQYPNTLAAVVAALMIGTLFHLSGKADRFTPVHSKPDPGSILSFLYALFLPALLFIFIYSQSRAAWLLFPIVWFIALFFLSLRRQLHFVLSTLLLGAVSLPLLPVYDQYVKEKNALFLLLLLGAGFLYALLSLGLAWLLKRWEKAPRGRVGRFLLPAFLLLAGIGSFTLIQTPAFVELLPDTIKGRLSDINLTTRSVAERGTFYEDSIALFKEHWLIGAGGNAWKGLFLKYETLPYYSSQTHSFAMKILVDTGVVGTLLFLTFFGILLYTLFRVLRKENFSDDVLYRIGLPFVTGTMLFLHSLVDFDMSYGYYALLFISFLALLYSEGRRERVELRLSFLTEYKRRAYVQGAKISFLLLAFIPAFFMLLYAYAESIPMRGLSAAQALANVERKISLKPVSVDYRLMRMDLLGQMSRRNGGEELVREGMAEGERILALDRYNAQTYLKVASFFGQYGDGIKALEYTEKGLENGKWFLPAYEQYISFATQVAILHFQNGKKEEGLSLLREVAARLTEIERKRGILDQQIESQRYPEFAFTEPIRRYGGQASYSLANPRRGSLSSIP
ncbi:membrane hypothetical protein [[Clostridium] ultunense Esp]|nr:membrane hypothetical protein [[Clostridium] ultunense Esp]